MRTYSKICVPAVLIILVLPILYCSKATDPENPPAAPSLIDPGGVDSDGVFSVTWSRVNGALAYVLEEDQDISFSDPEVVYEGSSTTANISARPDGTYYYRVNSSNGNGTSGWSSVVDITVQLPRPILLATPTSLNFDSTETSLSFDVTNVGTGTLTWGATTNEDWISMIPDSGDIVSETVSVTVTANRASLSPGNHISSIHITSNGGNDTLSVALKVPDETFSISDAWWTDVVDVDSDGYRSSGYLHFDVDVSHGSHSVYANVDCRSVDSADWSPCARTSNFLITGQSQSDAYAITIGSPSIELKVGGWDFRINIYRAGTSDPLLSSRDYSADAELGGVFYEQANLDQNYSISDAWWSEETDDDCDDYITSGKLMFDVDVSSGTYSIQAIIDYKPHGSYEWIPYSTTPNFTISGGSSADVYAVVVGSPTSGLAADNYDFAIRVYPESAVSPLLASRDNSIDDELDAKRFELADGPFPGVFQADQYTVALYHLDDGAGTVLLDESGKHNHGALQAGSWTSDAKFGSGIQLDGIDDYFVIPSPNQLGLQGGYTIELWAKPFGYNQNYCCENATCFFSASREQYEFFASELVVGGATRFLADRNSFLDGGSVQMGEWNYILASVDNFGQARFYLNGVLQAQAFGATCPPDNQSINVGRRVSGYFGYFHLNGIIDEIRISSVAREPCP
ncbi:MAG: choice-of-anchor H family protein [bacterium]